MMKGESSDPYYDIFEDFDLIAASLLSQYGVHVYSKEFKEMTWYEFCSLVSGLGPDTPLGRIVNIRAETDRDNIKNFSKDQRRIWREWRDREASNRSEQDMAVFLEEIKKVFIGMAGENVERKED